MARTYAAGYQPQCARLTFRPRLPPPRNKRRRPRKTKRPTRRQPDWAWQPLRRTRVSYLERARNDVPEPLAVDIDPARTFAVAVPLAMPAVTIVAEPHVAAIAAPDNEVAVAAGHDFVRADVGADADIAIDGPVDVHVFVDVNG